MQVLLFSKLSRITFKLDLPKTIYLPPETFAYEAYILDQPLPYILHVSWLWHCSFFYD